MITEEQKKLLSHMLDSLKSPPISHVPELLEPFSQGMIIALRGALMQARDNGQTELVSIPADASNDTPNGKALNALKAIY